MTTPTPAEATAAGRLIDLALAEDLDTAGDQTSRATIPADLSGFKIFQDSARDNRDELTNKVDYYVTTRDRLSATLGWSRRTQLDPFHGEIAEMLVQSRAPHRAYGVARLQHRPQARAGSSPHQAEMAAMRARHHLHNGVRLAMTARAQHDAFVGPVHDSQAEHESENRFPSPIGVEDMLFGIMLTVLRCRCASASPPP